MNNPAFFEGYRGQPYAAFDDIRSKTLDPKLVLDITNFTDIMVSVKGGSVVWSAREIWFTSLFSVNQCFPDSVDHGGIEQFIKRISITIHFTEKINHLSDTLKRRKAEERFIKMREEWKNVENMDNFDNRKIYLDDF
jgi:hypothetical protein